VICIHSISRKQAFYFLKLTLIHNKLFPLYCWLWLLLWLVLWLLYVMTVTVYVVTVAAYIVTIAVNVVTVAACCGC
jgi:hypothetical protein